MNAIACGVIDTSMNDQLTPEERKALEDEIPAGRYGTPKEIAQMVWNIVHAPEYMTGQIIGVDGGFYKTLYLFKYVELPQNRLFIYFCGSSIYFPYDYNTVGLLYIKFYRTMIRSHDLRVNDSIFQTWLQAL